MKPYEVKKISVFILFQIMMFTGFKSNGIKQKNWFKVKKYLQVSVVLVKLNLKKCSAKYILSEFLYVNRNCIYWSSYISLFQDFIINWSLSTNYKNMEQFIWIYYDIHLVDLFLAWFLSNQIYIVLNLISPFHYNVMTVQTHGSDLIRTFSSSAMTLS